jgi:HAMP domain-containing protein
VLIGLAFSWLIGRSITRPLDGLGQAMTRLAAGDTSAHIPATKAKDELGAMARTVIVFRDTMIERERLAESQAAANRERENRGEVIAATITRFETSVDQRCRGCAKLPSGWRAPPPSSTTPPTPSPPKPAPPSSGSGPPPATSPPRLVGGGACRLHW